MVVWGCKDWNWGRGVVYGTLMSRKGFVFLDCWLRVLAAQKLHLGGKQRHFDEGYQDA